MNRVARRKGNKVGRSKVRKNSYQNFIQHLENQFGVFWITPGSKQESRNQCIVVYDTKIPPSMPAPDGPLTYAHLSMRQYVAGSDMTLPTGSAIVGALLRQSTASDVFASFAFALADIPNISSVSALFDRYRIDRVQFRLRSRNPALFMMNQASPNYSATTPILALDRDDNTAPTTLSEIKQYSTCQAISACDSIDIVFEPSITPAAYGGGVFSGYLIQTDQGEWLDSANTNVPHYGIKVGIPALVTSTTSKMDWDIEAWYTVSFRDPR